MEMLLAVGLKNDMQQQLLVLEGEIIRYLILGFGIVMGVTIWSLRKKA